MTLKEKEKMISYAKKNLILPSSEIKISVDKYCEANFFGFPTDTYAKANPIKDCLTQSLNVLPQKHPIYRET